MLTRFLVPFSFIAISFFAFASEIPCSAAVNGKIVFVSDREGNDEIYVMNPDGTGQTRLTHYGGDDVVPAWSPDGRTIAFCRQNSLSGNSIYLMNREGTAERPIFHFCDGGKLAWSPDGQLISVGTWWGGVGFLSLNGAYGGEIDTGFGKGRAWDFAWSPDGSRFAFTGAGGGAYSNIFTMDLVVGSITQVSQGFPYTLPSSPDWSPDGATLVFADASEDMASNDSITLSNPDGTNLRRIFTSYDALNYSPTWSPDASTIVFTREGYPLDTNNQQIWAVNSAGGGLRQLTNGAHNNFSPDWQRVPSPTVQMRTAPFDYDGDGRTDLSVYRPSEGNWYIMKSGGGIDIINHAPDAGGRPAPADFDGDGKTDLAVFYEQGAIWGWYILHTSSNALNHMQSGSPGDLPVPADYDGGERADDVSTYRPSTGSWSLGTGIAFNWGLPGDKPAPADFNGDGAADITVFRPSDGRWYTINSGGASISINEWGLDGDKPVPGDYSGDGKADFCVYRPSDQTWYRRDAETNQVHIITWGLPGDLPVPGDYDGDGKNDLAVFRPSNSTWYIFGSTSGMYSQQWGLTGDMPTPNAFVN